MMSNRVQIYGHLGQKPELRETGSGKKVTNFSVASNERNETTWIDVAAWGNLAELCEKYLDKGSPVIVYGQLNQNVYEKDGKKIVTIRVTANSVRFLGKKDQDGIIGA
jgi:single-strand DNA-binding protein